MDDLDAALLALLRRDARAPLSTLAADLGVTRATVRARMRRLEEAGEVLGYTVVTRSDAAEAPVRGIVLVAIEGAGTRRVTERLGALPEVEAVHTTNGRWDLAVEFAAGTLEALDGLLDRLRGMEGVAASETSLYLATRRSRRASPPR